MTLRLNPAGVVVALLSACTASHLGDLCDGDEDCAPPLRCDRDRGPGSRRTCIATCDRAVDGRLCDSGAICYTPYCSGGGAVPEGDIPRARPGTGDADDCAFGLAGAYDYGAEPIVLRCSADANRPTGVAPTRSAGRWRLVSASVAPP